MGRIGRLETTLVLASLGLVFLTLAGWVTWSLRHLAKVEAARRQADAARRRSEDRFRTIFEQAPMGIALIQSESGQILEVNARYAALLGRTREALATLDWMDITHFEDVQKDLDQMARLKAGEIAGFQMDKRLLRQDGSAVWIRLTVAPMRVEEALSRCHLAMVEDITGRRQAEEERQRLQGQLIQTQKLEGLGSLAGGVAHDMNNVLGAILGLASTELATLGPDSASRGALAAIVQAAERGGRMVKGLLNFARHVPGEERQLNLNDLLQAEVRFLGRAPGVRVRLVLELARELRPVLGDGDALSQAFMNLLVNALDAMAGQGTLTLRTRNVDPDRVEVQVEDTGAGMAQEVLARCLDPFFTTKARGQGTGLGLALVHSTVHAHRGHLEIQSRPGQGTCMCLRFPAAQPGAGPPPAAPAQGTEPGPVMGPGEVPQQD